MLFALVGFVRVAAAQVPERAVLEAKVTGTSAERGVVALSTGREAGVAVGDRFWVFREGGIDLSGEIQTLTQNGSAGTAEGVSDISVGRPVTILRSAALTSYRESLPPEVTIRGVLARVTPGRRTAWLNIGARSGLKAEDTLLIRRLSNENLEIPLARGRVEIVRDDTALAVLQPIVGNTLPRPGDIAELWPSPSDRRLQRVESTVLASRPAAEAEGSMLLTIVGTAEDGLVRGRLVDLFRGDQYVGHASIAEVGDPNSRALAYDAGRRSKPQEGDRAWVRSPPGPPAHPLAAAIFQLTPGGDNDVIAQIAAGETDGVQVGEKFVVRHADPADPTIRQEIAELTVNAVNVDHCTALVRPLVVTGEKVQQWDFAERRRPALPDWREIGMVGRIVPDSHSATAGLEPQSTAAVGRIVRWIPEPAPANAPPRRAGAAIVINRSGEEAILYVPPGWGTVDDMLNAKVELADQVVGAEMAGEPPAKPRVPRR